MRSAMLAVLLLLLCGTAGPAVPAPADEATTPDTSAKSARMTGRTTALRLPALRVTRQVTGLTIPWDVHPVAGGLLITERDSARLRLWRHGRLHAVRFPSRHVWVSGETGLMSVEVDRAFDRNRRVYTCQGGYLGGGRHDVRVIAWRLSRDATRVAFVRRLVDRLPATSGRHGGCRLLILRDGSLLVGTGDSATGWVPQSLRSLGGKTLRLNRFTGAPWPHNPWPRAADWHRRYVFTYGHRNVQGLAQRWDGTLWSVEHGSYRDDEVNRLVKGGNYGWHPVPGYNETVPMTDFSLPGRQWGARWRSGEPTLATSGATWVRGRQWGGYRGTLAVAALKSSRLLFIKFDTEGRLRWVRAPAAVRNFGRLRSVAVAPDGDLLVTTSNGSRDAVLRVSPR